MLAIYNLGVYFLDSLSEIGDWLMVHPLSGLSSAMTYLRLSGQLTWQPDFLVEFVEGLQNWTLAGIIFGGGLVTVLGLKVVSFITDVVT